MIRNQLVQATRVKFTMSDETTLADLLSLNLHNFEDEVHNIVDKACKEMGMEKLLHDLQNVWKELNFDYEDHVSGNVMDCIHLIGRLITNQATNC